MPVLIRLGVEMKAFIFLGKTRQSAKNLEFERAAQMRDQLKKLRENIFISPI